MWFEQKWFLLNWRLRFWWRTLVGPFRWWRFWFLAKLSATWLGWCWLGRSFVTVGSYMGSIEVKIKM